MKKVLMGLVAGMILATGAQALAYVCDNDTCTLPARGNPSNRVKSANNWWLTI